jgi:hypothetical protein
VSFENIDINATNFCIGPQAGTFCFVDFSDINNVVMRVKNSSGDLIRSYIFMPKDTFYTDASAYPYNYIVDFKYAGPKNLNAFYSGAVFYTLEREVSGYYYINVQETITYSDKCVIREWVLDEESFTLNLENTWIKTSDSSYYFDTFSISPVVYQLSFIDSTTNGTGAIKVTNSDILTEGVVLFLGPSTDQDNYMETEKVYVHSISGDVITIRSLETDLPTKYEYVSGDPITTLGDVFLFTNPRPILNDVPIGADTFGDGHDGTITVTEPDTIINSYAYSVDDYIVAGTNSITLNSSTGFYIGQEILIHQTQCSDNEEPGIYEFNSISDIQGNIIILSRGIVNNYVSSRPNTLEAYLAQIISVPNFISITINSGASITCKKWDGYTGGMVVLKANGIITFKDGSLGINISNSGFRGGGTNGGGNNAPGDPGEGYTGLGWQNNLTVSNCSPNTIGGGGGYGPSGYGGTAGAGGALINNGEDATDASNPPAVAQGGNFFSYKKPEHLVFGGGGGGGGDDDLQTTPDTCKGGDGAGLLILISKTIRDCKIIANGEDGVSAGGNSGGTGGGGAGGAIYIVADAYTEDLLQVDGGKGGLHIDDTAGSGSEGYIKKTTAQDQYITGYASNGFLYRLDLQNYGQVITADESALYTSVLSSVWNNTTGGLTFVKDANYLTVDIYDNFEVIKSQVLFNITDTNEVIEIYAIDYSGIDLFFLQKKRIVMDDSGYKLVIYWDNYNYVSNTIQPYTISVNAICDSIILNQYEQVILHIYVKDQFNNGVLGANVFVTFIGDPSGLIDPISGYVISDADGYCFITYKASSTYKGETVFTIKADKGNIYNGSEYVVSSYTVVQPRDSIGTVILQTIQNTFFSYINFSQIYFIEASNNLSCYSKYIFGPGHYFGEYIEYDYDNDLRQYFIDVLRKVDIYLIKQVHFPLMATYFYETPISGKLPLVSNTIRQESLEGTNYITTAELPQDNLLLDQLSASRHSNNLNSDAIIVSQYVFIQDAIPAFWAEKVTVNTSIWIRMRPFAYSLDPATLKFEVREYNSSLNIDTTYIDITSLGQITLYDAGSGMFGIDFLYQPSNFFNNESIVYVRIVVYDTAPVPNILNVTYWFKIIDDYKGPYVYNESPVEGAVVPLDTPIVFCIKDLGIGLSIEDIELFINNSIVTFTHDVLGPADYKIYYSTTDKFSYGSFVSVNVTAVDRSKYKNISFSFWTFKFEESTGPFIDISRAKPKPCSEGVPRVVDNISFQIYAIDNTGLDVDSVSISVANKDFIDYFYLLPIITSKNNIE